MTRIAIVGSGPMALYALSELVRSASPLSISIYEKSGSVGTGTPYSRQINHPQLLANIASIEIPPLLDTLTDWLESRTAGGLTALGIARSDIHDRTFFPRVLVGAYLRDQFVRLCEIASVNGHQIDVSAKTTVTNISGADGDVELTLMRDDQRSTASFDYTIVATGHVADEAGSPGDTYHDSPYPTSRLMTIGKCRVGILGTSLSAIDAAVTIAYQHGRFEGRGPAMRYVPADPSGKLEISLMSRSGLLPETDFFVPMPYEPLDTFTPAAIHQEVAQGQKGLLDRVFDLFSIQLAGLDPAYAERVGLASATVKTYPDIYFADRVGVDPIQWARLNLAATLALNESGKTTAWKYAILRMHEVFELAVPYLSERDRKLFAGGLQKIFVDNYAAVPPESIARLIALDQAGVLRVVPLGSNYLLNGGTDGEPFAVSGSGTQLVLDVLIDATGESARPISQLPFATLRRQLTFNGLQMCSLTKVPVWRDNSDVSRVYLAALPYLLGRRPFAQGLVSCHEIGATISKAILQGLLCPVPALERVLEHLLQAVELKTVRRQHQ